MSPTVALRRIEEDLNTKWYAPMTYHVFKKQRRWIWTFSDLSPARKNWNKTPLDILKLKPGTSDASRWKTETSAALICCVTGIDQPHHQRLQTLHPPLLLQSRRSCTCFPFNPHEQLITPEHLNILQTRIRNPPESFPGLRWARLRCLYSRHMALNLVSLAGGKWHCCLHPLLLGIPVVVEEEGASFNARGRNRQWQNVPDVSLWSLPEKQSQ